MENIFGEVYEYVKGKSKYRGLYNALNREDVQAVIVYGGHWWTEHYHSSRGLSEAQYRGLAEVINRLRGPHDRLA